MQPELAHERVEATRAERQRHPIVGKRQERRCTQSGLGSGRHRGRDDAPEAVVFAGDGQVISRWGAVLEAAGARSTMIVSVHGLADETLRLHEYSPGFRGERFAAHERFFVEGVRKWVAARFGVALPIERTAVCGVSAGGGLALAMGVRHPDLYGAVL